MRLKIEVFILATLTFTFINGCSNKSTPVTVEPTGSTQADTADDDTDYNYQTASNSNQNLWDTTTVNDVPAVSPSPSPSPSPVAGSPYYPSQMHCLGGTQNYATNNTSTSGSNPPWYGSGSPSTMSTSCFDPSWGGFFGDDMLFDAGIGAFGAMQGCYNTVMSRAPQFCSAGYGVEEVFQMSQMALVRCFRAILRKQMQLVYWAAPQVQSFQQTDASFYLLLQLFSQESK